MKWAYLLNLSTTTKMMFFPLELGKPSTKSILMSTKGAWGMGRGWSRLGVLTFSLLFF